MEMEKSKVLIQFLLIFRQSGDVLSFLYALKLRGYTATESLFQLANAAGSTNTKWQYNILNHSNSDLLVSLIVPGSNILYTGALLDREDNTRAFLCLYSGRMLSDNAYIQMERRDLHNISHIKLIYARPNFQNVSGRFRIFLLNELHDWIEVLKFDNNQNLTEEYVWGVENVNIGIKIFGIMLKYDNVKTNKEDMAISRVILTYAV